LRAWHDPGVRPVPLLVPALLLIAVRAQAMFRCEAAFGRPRCLWSIDHSTGSILRLAAE
jgi:hypothetical protein